VKAGTAPPNVLSDWLVPAGLLYGAIVTAAVLVAAGGHSDSVGRILASWAFVLGTYWANSCGSVALFDRRFC